MDSYNNVSQDEPRARVAASGFMSQQQRNTISKDSKDKATLTDRVSKMPLADYLTCCLHQNSSVSIFSTY